MVIFYSQNVKKKKRKKNSQDNRNCNETKSVAPTFVFMSEVKLTVRSEPKLGK